MGVPIILFITFFHESYVYLRISIVFLFDLIPSNFRQCKKSKKLEFDKDYANIQIYVPHPIQIHQGTIFLPNCGSL